MGNTTIRYESISKLDYDRRPDLPDIKKVIFHDPATIIFWEDGTKTVVKCQEGDVFDPEKGMAMAITKKALGNKGNYYNKIKAYIKDYKEDSLSTSINISLEELLENECSKSFRYDLSHDQAL